MTANKLDVSVIIGCHRLLRVEAVELGSTVELQAWVDVPETEGCFTSLSYEAVSVLLTLPLGGRELIGCLIEQSGRHSDRSSCAELVSL